MKRYKEATCNNLIKAYSRAVKAMSSDERITEHSESAGYLLNIEYSNERTGFQVFVTISRFDEALLKSNPTSGGLLKCANESSSD